MEPLNDDMNDMDALFRRAAKGYQLKEGDGNWENVSGRLLTNPEAISSPKKSKRRKYFGLIIILLFLISGGSMFYFRFPSALLDESQIGNNENNLDKNTSSFTSEPQKTILKDNGKDQSKGIRTLEVPGEKSGIGSHAKEMRLSENLRANNSGSEFIRSTHQVGIQRLISLPGPALPGKNISVLEGTGFLPDLQAGDTTKSLNETLTKSKGNNRRFVNKNKAFYFGLTGGLDFSNVKSQAINKTGYNLGLLAGYRFNRRISVESGILWIRKEYYSDGKYFSMNKVGPSMPSNMKIMAVDGQFTLLEIPFKLKYDFAFKTRSNLFISTGISSNICLKERNNYLTEMNGLQEYHIGLYKDVLYCPISLINISAGYEHGLGKSRTLRLEPYIKIPLKKVGMGSMPVFSTGINVSISNFFSKGRP